MHNDKAGDGKEFREGDKVVLDRGPHQGTPGVFICLAKDVKWADIREPNGSVQSHPLEWLAHAPRPTVVN